MTLQGKAAFITGSSSGIGRAAATLFAKEGAHVAIHGTDAKDVEQVVQQIQEDGGRAEPYAVDLKNADALKEAIDDFAEKAGGLDIVFANAGVNGVWAPLDELKLEEFDETIAINLRGSFATLKFAMPHMKERGGSMIITSSINGTRVFSNSGATAYSCSKAGQVALCKMLALELAKYRIRVNVICPGAIMTHIFESTKPRNVEEAQEPIEFPEGGIPLTDGKPGEPNQVAQLALFLASDASNLITGTEVYIDGAESLLRG